MAASDLIGLLITFLALIFLLSRGIKKERSRPVHLPPKDAEEERHIKQILKSLNIEEEEDEEEELEEGLEEQPKRLTHFEEKEVQSKRHSERTVQDQFQFQSKLEDYRRKQTAIENRDYKTNIESHEAYADSYGDRVVSVDLRLKGAAYDVIGKRTPARINQLLEKVPSKKEMILLQEIISPPKALREIRKLY